MRGEKRINTLDFCSYMRAYQFFMSANTSMLGARTFLVRAYQFFMRAKTSSMRADTFEMSFATRQNYIFGGMLPKHMTNGSKTAVVKATFTVIPPWDVAQ
jgi:hypothetical protein